MALPLQILFKVFSSMKISNFLQGLVGFGNLRFAEIKSCPSASPELRKVEISPILSKKNCPSASPTYELRKVEISSKNYLAKLQKFWEVVLFFDKPPYYCREKNIKKN